MRQITVYLLIVRPLCPHQVVKLAMRLASLNNAHIRLDQQLSRADRTLETMLAVETRKEGLTQEVST
jgi:uncharacterized protein YcnI